MLRCALVVLSVVFVLLPTHQELQAQILTDHYPDRLPDWLWTQQEFAGYVPAAKRSKIEAKIARADTSDESVGEDETWKLIDEVAAELAESFARRDLTRDTEPLVNAKEKTRLCLRIDPAFSSDQAHLIRRAADLFMLTGTDAELIQRTMDASNPRPEPFPPEFELDEHGQPKLDPYKNKIVTEKYLEFQKFRAMPPSAQFLRNQLLEAMSTSESDPGLLIVAHYSHELWWGGGRLPWYDNPTQLLRREVPAQGYLYIALTAEKMGNNDPAFWAGKIAHEVLHNLGYAHPIYSNPEERDRFNDEKSKAKSFIVLYERAVTDACQRQIINPNRNAPAR